MSIPRRASLLVCSGALACAFSFACSSSTSDAPSGTGDGGNDGATSSDAGRDPDSGAEAAASDKIGAVFAISDSTVVDGGVKGAHRAGGFFARTISPDTTTQTKTVGPCLLETIGNGELAKEELASAGVLHLAGGKKTLDIAPKADKSYEPTVSGTDSLWNGGETLTASADGKDVPSFTVSLKAPSKVTLTAPAATAGSFTIDRTYGFNATFTGASSGVVVLYFDVATASNAFTATCTFDVAAGSAKVPAGAFADFPAIEGTFNFYVKESAVTTASDWNVRFTASSVMVNGSGEALEGRATFQ